MKVTIPENHKTFCKSVIALVKAYAQMAALKNRVADGEVLEEKEIGQLKQLLCDISHLMNVVDSMERMFGYEDVGFPFMEDAEFNGFSIKNGELTGDLHNAYLIAEPWYCDFVYYKKSSESDCFKFFIAAFIVHMTDMLCPELRAEGRDYPDSRIA